MHLLKLVARTVSSWPFTPLVARGVALLGVTTVLAHIGQGALTRLDSVSVAPAFAGSSEVRPTTSPSSHAHHVASGAASVTHQPAAHAPSSEPARCGGAPGCDDARQPGVTADGLIILNHANAAELVRLPGVGQRRAEAILALRKRLGRFRRVRDLLRVRGIGFRSLRKIQPLVVVDPPKPPKSDEGSKRLDKP